MMERDNIKSIKSIVYNPKTNTSKTKKKGDNHGKKFSL